MDQRRHRGGAGHGVGEPDVERDLGALAHGADEQAEGDEAGQRQAQRVGPGRQLRVGGDAAEDLAEVQGAEDREQGEQPDQEAEVADPVDDERLHPGVGRPVLLVVEADQQVGAEPHPLPADEHHQEVVAQDQQQHRPHEQVEVDEVALVALLVGHVADRVDVDPEADEGDDEHHHRRQRVEQEGDVEVDRPGGPGVEGLLDGLRVEPPDEVAEDRRQGDHQRDAGNAQPDGGGHPLGRPRPGDGVGRRAGEGQQGDEPEQVGEVHSAHQRSRLTRSRSMVRRWR